MIVCEGEKTEPNYFHGFRANTHIIDVDIRGTGFNTKSLVRQTIALKNRDEYDEVWCVFDRDSFTRQAFNAALTMADANGINVAYSNEAFELWYLLHFNYYDTAIPRASYCERLGELLGHPYRKNSGTLYDELVDRQKTAIRNARKLLATYTPNRPVSDNPSTTVFRLVEELNQYLP